MNLSRALSLCLVVLLMAGSLIGQDATQKSPAAKTMTAEDGWRLREMELMARIRGLELELVQERTLRLKREQEWIEFSKLLSLLPEEKRPEIPGFLQGQVPELSQSSAEAEVAPIPEAVEAQQQLLRAAEIKSILRAYLRAEGVRGLDLLEVGLVGEGFIGPIVARQLDESGRFLSTLVADRLRLEKSRSGFTLTLVLERGYERRAGQIWPFPNEHSTQPNEALGELGSSTPDQAERTGVLRIPLSGVKPGPWIEALPELFSAKDLDRAVSDGSHDPFALRYSMNHLLGQPRQGGRWRLVSLGGVVASQWRDVHLAELSLEGHVVRRIFADRGQLSLQGDNLMFSLESGAQERSGVRTPFLAGRYTLVLTHVDRAAWLGAGLPGVQ
jgi:hypothetical protein